jgi:hypothetical protein
VSSRPLQHVRDILARHPRSTGGVFLFCLFMTLVYMPYDVFAKLVTQDVSQAEEVWFGYMLRGTAAKLTEPLHWAIYGALAHGFWHERPWAWTLGALYTLQVSIGSLVWSFLYGSYGPVGMVLAVLVTALFAWLALALWRARPAAGAAR